MIINGTDYGENYSLSLKEHKELHKDLPKFRMMTPEQLDEALENEYYEATGKKRPVKKTKEEGE